MKNSRRCFWFLLPALLLLGTTGLVQAEQQKITVFKTPTCGCCKKWVDHLEQNGFAVETQDMNDLRMVKAMSGIDPKLASCHTARVGQYVEGHVPAEVIARMLKEQPDIRGLAVPGMPAGSPGMEGPRKVPYDVMAIGTDGSLTVYESR